MLSGLFFMNASSIQNIKIIFNGINFFFRLTGCMTHCCGDMSECGTGFCLQR